MKGPQQMLTIHRVRKSVFFRGAVDTKECRSNGTIASNVLQRRLAWVRLCNAGRALCGGPCWR